MDNKIVDVSHLTVTYGDTTVVNNISFTVYQHDVIVILGPNGGGKTTLLKALVGLVPYKGTIAWHTQSIGYLPPPEAIFRTRIPSLTVQDFFSLKGASVESVKHMIHEVGLQDSIRNKPISTLSTGQFQRMMLAWVCINKPAVLLLDEPTAGIDVGGQETIFSLLHRLWKEWKLTIIVITHNAHIIWKHATKVLCINKDLICFDTPEKALNADVLKHIYGTEVSFYEHKHLFSE